MTLGQYLETHMIAITYWLASACIKMASYCTASLTSCVFPLFFGIHIHEGKRCPKKSIIYSQIIHPSSEIPFLKYESDFPIFFDIYTLGGASYAEGIIIHPNKVIGLPLECLLSVWQINFCSVEGRLLLC